ncbi:MAG: FIST N-terminal domain-containing protein [Pseudomonadota bacterium]
MYIPSSDSKEIISTITKMEIKKDDVVAIMIGEKNKPDIHQIISGLNENGIKFFGGIFPGIIYRNYKYEEGAILMVLPVLEKPFLIKGLNTEQIEIPDFGKEIMENHGSKYTAMILVDGLTSNISFFLSEMFNRLGNSVHYFGGGAGSLTLKQEPCLFTSEGFAQDAAIVTFIKLNSHLGVRHGWERIMGPFVATKTRKNIIMELNWKNAFEVYRETVEGDSGKKLTPENFFDIAKGYPFGIHKEGMEDIVRDPISVNQKSELFCVGEVPENTVLSILKGEKASLIQAAGQAAEDCLQSGAKNIRQCLIADCISRAIFLEENFIKELEIVNRKIPSSDPQHTPMGILTLGEISSYGEGYLEFFNKTIVVGVLYEG